MQVILHIGTEKTGTTSFQAWLSSNSEHLWRQGIWVPRCLTDALALSICASDGDKPDDRFLLAGISSAQEFEDFKKKTRSALEHEFDDARDARCRAALISSEHLHSRLTRGSMVENLRRFLDGLFDEYNICVHLRPQVDVAVSLATTAARLGKRVDRKFFENAHPYRLYYDYNSLIHRWEGVFGRESVSIVAYKRQSDFRSYIVERLQLTSRRLKVISNGNTALGVGVIALSNAMNLPYITSDGVLDANRSFFIDRLPPGPSLSIGLDLARKFQSMFDDGNRQLVARRSDISYSDLEPDWSKYNTASNIELLERDCAFSEQLRALVRQFNGELHVQRALNYLLECELAMERGNLEGARHCADKSKLELKKAEQVQEIRPRSHELMKRLERARKQLRSY